MWPILKGGCMPREMLENKTNFSSESRYRLEVGSWFGVEFGSSQSMIWFTFKIIMLASGSLNGFEVNIVSDIIIST